MHGVALLLLPALAWILDAGAQEYPIRPIRLIVASSPGSGVDTVGGDQQLPGDRLHGCAAPAGSEMGGDSGGAFIDADEVAASMDSIAT